jgi:hypothetical protein
MRLKVPKATIEEAIIQLINEGHSLAVQLETRPSRLLCKGEAGQGDILERIIEA